MNTWLVGNSSALTIAITVAAARFVVIIGPLAQNLRLDLLVFFLVLKKVGVEFINIKPLLDLQLIVQRDLVGNLVVLFYQVKALWNNDVVLVLVFSNLEENLDHVLYTLVDSALMQDSTESFVNPVVSARRIFGKVRAYFTHEANSNFHRVVGWLLEKENKNLESNDFVCDALVDEMSDERSGRVADNLVISLEGPPELANKPRQHQLSNLGKFRINNRHQRRKNRSKRQRRSLRLHHAPRKQPPPANQVLPKQLRHDMLDIRHVHPVHDTRDTLPQRVPRQTLVLCTRLVFRRSSLESAQPCRRDVYTTRARAKELRKFGLSVESWFCWRRAKFDLSHTQRKLALPFLAPRRIRVLKLDFIRFAGVRREFG